MKKHILLFLSLLIASCTTTNSNTIKEESTFVEIKPQNHTNDIFIPQISSTYSSKSELPKIEQSEEKSFEKIVDEKLQNSYDEEGTTIYEENQVSSIESNKSKVTGEGIESIYTASNISIYAKDLKSKKEIKNYNSERVAIPASVMKLVTSATVYEYIGENYRYETSVYTDGTNLYIVGSGDPTLGSVEFEDKEGFIKNWINAINSKGITQINGDIVIGTKTFKNNGIYESWQLDDIGTTFGAGVYGFTVFDNLYSVVLSSSDTGVKVINSIPKVDNVNYESLVTITSTPKKSLKVLGMSNSKNKVIVGDMKPNQNGIYIRTDISNPASFFGEYFKKKLADNGIKVNGKVKVVASEKLSTDKLELLATHKSPEMKEIIRLLLKKSNNNYTEHLYQLLLSNGVDIKSYWKKRGLDVEGVNMLDGSGLSRGNYLTAKFLTELLEYMYQKNRDFIFLLPQAGKEGTVKNFLVSQNLKETVYVKSGSMSGVQAYSGYIISDTKKGAFSIIVNHWEDSRATLKKKMEECIGEIDSKLN